MRTNTSKIAFILFLVFWGSFLLGAGRYYCPMHCQGSKTYEHPGTCPICHMKLEKETDSKAPRDQAVSAVKFRVDTLTSAIPVDKDVEIPLFPRKAADGAPLTDLSDADGLPLKVDLVSQKSLLLREQNRLAAPRWLLPGPPPICPRRKLHPVRSLHAQRRIRAGLSGRLASRAGGSKVIVRSQKE